jgi:hypothetical protein
MSIFPAAVDLVTDVAQAADPQKRSAAVSRLSEMSATRLRSDDDFSKLVAGAQGSDHASAKTGVSPRPSVVLQSQGSVAGISKSATGTEAAEKFEAFVIQSCLETILPKADEGLFGHGAAGSAWRSMLAEQIGLEIAKAGGLGLKSMLVDDLSKRDGNGSATPKSAAT